MLATFPTTREQYENQRRESELNVRFAERVRLSHKTVDAPSATVLKFPLWMTRYADPQFTATH